MAECNCKICLTRSGKLQKMIEAEERAKEEARRTQLIEQAKKDDELRQQQYEQELRLAEESVKNLQPLSSFELGWIQVPLSLPKNKFFEEYVFTASTAVKDRNRILSLNSHLNDPLKKGEIVLVSHGEPFDDTTRNKLQNLTEQSQAVSEALAELSDAENDVLHKYLLLFDELTSEYLLEAKLRGWPTDKFAQVSAGIGALATGTKSHLESINSILKDIENLYIEQVAKPASMGQQINYQIFTSQRTALFSKLDNSLSKLTLNSLNIPTYEHVKNTLKLSTKSVVHNADEIVRGRSVPDFGKRIANVSSALKGTEAIGKVGIVLSAASAGNSIYDACVINESGKCAKTSTVEVVGFLGGLGGGVVGDVVGSTIGGTAMVIIGVSSAPVIGVAIATGAVVGSVSGGIIGGGAAKIAAESIYDTLSDAVGEFLE
ncbi:hypothetical protein GA069_26070 [Vibrio parahaemolyticus]|nr:hypothetical protein [Vibrio parahaemolyticus]